MIKIVYYASMVIEPICFNPLYTSILFTFHLYSESSLGLCYFSFLGEYTNILLKFIFNIDEDLLCGIRSTFTQLRVEEFRHK